MGEFMFKAQIRIMANLGIGTDTLAYDYFAAAIKIDLIEYGKMLKGVRPVLA